MCTEGASITHVHRGDLYDPCAPRGPGKEISVEAAADLCMPRAGVNEVAHVAEGGLLEGGVSVAQKVGSGEECPLVIAIVRQL